MASQIRSAMPVDQTAEICYGEILSEIRTWLDKHKIEPVLFKPAAVIGRHGLGFEITFRSPEQARQFEKAFPAGRWIKLPAAGSAPRQPACRRVRAG